MAAEVITAALREGVGLVTIDRPQVRNALDVATLRNVRDAVAAFDADPAVRCIVISGAGDRAFSSGYDIKELAGFAPDAQLRDYLTRDNWLWDIASSATPTVAALNGAAHGGGVLLAAVCDLRVGSPASSVSITAARYDGATGTWMLPPLVGHGVAKEWLMTGREVSAEEAYARGFLNRLVTADRVHDEALALAATIAANPPGGVRAIKRLIDTHVGRTRDDARRAETAAMLGELAPRPVAETFATFLAKKDAPR